MPEPGSQSVVFGPDADGFGEVVWQRCGRSFATIHSYIATAAKHDVDAFGALAGIFRGDVWMPPATT